MSIQRIPKLFFQTSKAPLKPYLIQMIKAQLTGEWTYMHFLDSDILEFFKENPLEEFPGVSEKFKALKHGEHKADLFRYYFLFVKGGVFLDSDAMIYAPIESIIKDYRFFSVRSAVVPGTVFQGILGAEPGNPLILRALKSFYSMDIKTLESDYHILCRELFTFYQDIPEGERNLECAGYKLYNEKPAFIDDTIRKNKYLFNGDMVLNDEGHTIFKHYWLNKEGIPNTLKSKNLVYCCVFYNKDYFKLLDLLLKSMKMYSSVGTFDFLIMTSPEFEPEVKRMAIDLNLDLISELNLKIFTLDFKTIFQAACARLFIFEYPEISGYEKLLYLDTDIIIKGDLARVFALPIEDLLYGISSGNIGSQSFGAQFFNFGEIDQNLAGINSGTLLFLNSENMRNLFEKIKNHVKKFTDEGNQPPYCMDQPFINFHAIKSSLYNNQILNSLVSLFEGDDTVDNFETSVICHFSFPIGNFGHKFQRMRDFLSKTLSFQKHMYASPDIIGNKYSWGQRQVSGSNAFIKFYIDESWNLVAETTWGKASVKILDYNIFIVEWHNHKHVMKLNDDFTSYISIRIEPIDFDFISGSRIQSNLNIYGDSHALLLFKGLQVEHRNLFHFGKTMFRVGRDQWIMNFKQEHSDPNRIFCLTYGEVDVRAHIGKQVFHGRHHLQVCNELVEAYMNAIKVNILRYKAIIVVAVPPPVDPADHTHTHYEPLPFIGTNSDRVIYTNDLNNILKMRCQENGFHFIDPFAFYKREDGMLNYTLSDGCIHIGKNKNFLEAFTILYNSLI